MSVKKIFFTLCLSVIICNGAIVDNLFKCGMDDASCHTKLVQKLFGIIVSEGAEELDIPVLDPYKLSHIDFDIPDLLNLNLQNGVVDGVKTCHIDSFNLNFEKGFAFLTTTCTQLVFKGQYKLDASAPVIKSLLGGDSISGEGKTKVNIEKLKLNFQFHFDLKERDGKVYTNGKGKVAELISFDIGKVTFKLDKIYLGKEEASKLITEFMNSNWRLMLSTFGKVLINKILGVGVKHLAKVFDTIPLNEFIIEDLSQYVD